MCNINNRADLPVVGCMLTPGPFMLATQTAGGVGGDLAYANVSIQRAAF